MRSLLILSNWRVLQHLMQISTKSTPKQLHSWIWKDKISITVNCEGQKEDQILHFLSHKHITWKNPSDGVKKWKFYLLKQKGVSRQSPKENEIICNYRNLFFNNTFHWNISKIGEKDNTKRAKTESRQDNLI